MSKIKETFIQVFRKFIDWEWYKNTNVKVLFLHLLLVANHKTNNWQGIEVKRGQRLTSIKHLSNETGLSEQNIKTALKKLKSTGELTSISTSKYTIISVLNYDYYQNANKQTNKRLTNNQQTTNKQLTTNNNDNNVNNDNKKTYSEECQKLIDYFLTFFNGDILDDLKDIKKNESFLKTADNLLRVKKKEYEYIKTSIKKGKSISYYKDHFQSFNRLLKKNREGDLYVDVYFRARELDNNQNTKNNNFGNVSDDKYSYDIADPPKMTDEEIHAREMLKQKQSKFKK